MTLRLSMLSVAVALATSACASDAIQDSSDRLAATPEQAAIGYDKSVRMSVQGVRQTQARDVQTGFACPNATIASGIVTSDESAGASRYTARATKVGKHWKVTVDVEFDENSGSESTYEVQRLPGGFCVSGQTPGRPLR